MLLLPEKKAIFYHVYKVAGTSIRRSLLPYAPKWQVIGQAVTHALILARLPHPKSPLLRYHPDLKDVRRHLGAEFDDYYKFSFVRDPLDWQKSVYFFILKRRYLPRYAQIPWMTFSQYLDWRMSGEMQYQSHFLYDGDERMVDDIFKFENIQADFRVVADKLGIEADLPFLNKAGAGRKVEIEKDVLDRFLELNEREYARLGYTLKMPSSFVLS